MSEFHFIRAEWFTLLIPLAGLMLWWHLRRLYKGNWARVVDPHLQQYVLSDTEKNHSNLSSWLFFIATFLTIFAMAGPAWERLPMPVFKDESALIIALDLSRSMDAQDIQPSRLQRARLKLIDILRQKRAGQSALLVYAADAFVVTPLTDDIETIIAHVPNLTTDMMPSQGSRADRAIEKAIQLFEQTGVRSGDVLLITDEADTRQLNKGLPELRAAGHSLLLLGVGSTEGAPIPEQAGGFVKDKNGSIVIAKLNESELRAIAPYQQLSFDDRDINALFRLKEIDPLSIQAKRTELNTDTWRDQGPWLLLPVLVLALAGFRRGLFLFCLLCLLPLPQTSIAADWQSLWLNKDQRGVKALDEKNAAEAAELFNNPEWKAAAHYRAGQYEQALATLEGIEKTDALYNKANALAKLGQFEEAIETYNRVLKSDPEHKDAKYNRDLLTQQQQQSSDSQQNSEQDQNSQQQQSDSSQKGSEQDSQQQQADSQQQQSEQQNSQQKDNSSDQESDSSQSAQSGEEQAQVQQMEAKKNPDKSDEEMMQAEQSVQPEDTTPDAEQQAIEQWLRRVPDDPGGLLRRKFMYQYRQQQSDKESKQW